MRDLISVIVPAYNVAQYIEKCLNSILNQTYTNIEVIIVDDGSTDQTGIICDSFLQMDYRVKVIHQINGGRIKARRMGYDNSHGEYVSFIDADDWIETDYLEKLMVPFQDEDIDISVSTYTFDGMCNAVYIDRGPIKMDKSYALLEMIKSNFFNWSLCDKLYKRRILDNVILNSSECDMCEDMEFNWKAFNISKSIYYAPIRKYHYVFRNDSITHEKFRREHLIIIERFYRMIKACDKDKEPELYYIVLNKAIASSINKLFVGMICDVVREDDFEKYKKYIYEWLVDKECKYYNIKLTNFFMMNYKKAFEYVIAKKNSINEQIERVLINELPIYIYGAGAIGKTISIILDQMKINYNGFVVTYECRQELIRGKQVKRIIDVEKSNILIAGNRKNQQEMICYLNKIGRHNYCNVGEYISDFFL